MGLVSLEKSARLYGQTISESTITYFRRCTNFLIALCLTGTVCQIIQIPAPVPLEFVCAFIYLAYNVTTMLVVRVANVSFKFEDTRCLWMTVKIGASMSVYTLSVVGTTWAFQSNAALALMSVFGVVNVIIILPTNIYEDSMLLIARTHNLGMDKAEPLGFFENLLVVGFIFVGNAIVVAVIVSALLLASGTLKTWLPLKVLYLLMNLIPIILPMVEHLVATEPRTWPLKGLIIQFVLVIAAVVFFVVALVAGSPSRTNQIFFATVGVINGFLVALSLTMAASKALCNPRYVKGLELAGKQEPKPDDDTDGDGDEKQGDDSDV